MDYIENIYVLTGIRWWTKWGLWLAVRVSSGEAATKHVYRMVYCDRYFTIYIHWFIFAGVGFGHYNKSTLKD